EIEIQGPRRGWKTQTILNETCCCGQKIVGALRAQQDKINRFRVASPGVEQPLNCVDSQIRRAFVLRCYMPLLNSRLSIDLFHGPFGKLRGKIRCGKDV